MPETSSRSKSVAIVFTALLIGTFVARIPTLGASAPGAMGGQFDQQISGAQVFGQGAYASSTPHLTLPKLMKQVEPKYTSDALRAQVQGDVNVDVVVLADGTVGDAQVSAAQPQNALHDYYYSTSGVGPQIQELRDEALKAVRGWTFTPGLLNGKAVPVVVTETLSFRIH